MNLLLFVVKHLVTCIEKCCTNKIVIIVIINVTVTVVYIKAVSLYRYCIPNAVEDTTNDRVLRLNLNAHPLSYINDQDMGTTWLSRIMTSEELDEGVTITVDLTNGQYQVTHLISI